MSSAHHVVFVCLPEYGHIRPAVPVIVKIAQERSDILITVPVIGRFKDLTDREIARYLNNKHSALKDQIRVIQISTFNGVSEFDGWEHFAKVLPDFMDKLASCDPIICSTGQNYPSVLKPSLYIADVSLCYGIEVKQISERGVKVIIFNTSSAAPTLAVAGPLEYGGYGEMEAQIEELAERKNISAEEATHELFRAYAMQVRRVAGLPPVNGYELGAEHEAEGSHNYWVQMARRMSKFVRDSDGIIMANSPVLEGGTIEAFKEWFARIGKSSYSFGPCLIPDEMAPEELTQGQKVVEFMDKIYESHGRNSLLYISFGTVIFPSGETPWQLIDIIIDMKVPLILALPFRDTYEKQIPNETRTRLESSNISLVVKWAPQHAVLNHRATGFFFTHGGQGSITEALVSGIPMIVWPLQADQCFNAIYLVLNLKVAYQPLEVRIKHGLLPLYRGYTPTGTKEAIDREFRKILSDAFGQDGETKRKIAQELSAKLRVAWKENGEALTELRRFLSESF